MAEDADQDGLTDLILAFGWNPEFRVLSGLGDGRFGNIRSYPFDWHLESRHGFSVPVSPELVQADFNEDGSLDVLFTAAALLRTFHLPILLTGPQACAITIKTDQLAPIAAVADFDGDGHTDLVI